MQYAIHELYSLVRSLGSPFSDRSPKARYLCALVSELAYHHIPNWEIDDKKRAKLIPSEAYQELFAEGRATDIRQAFQQLDLPNGFVVEDRGVVSTGVVIDKLLFIGFRGTQFLFDWKVNLTARLAPITPRFRMRPASIYSTLGGGLHSGFAEEAIRISSKISDAISDAGLSDIEHVFLTGHSLGGAVAAISENFLRLGPTSVIIFGAPRYADLAAYFSMQWSPPTQIRRPYDVVPTIPPRFFGYADHPYEFATNGTAYVDPNIKNSMLGEIKRWIQFLARRIEPHSMESYRREVGLGAGAVGSNLPLVPIRKLTINDIVD